MQHGSFYCFIPRRGHVTGFLPFSKAVQRDLHRRLHVLVNNASAFEGGETGAALSIGDPNKPQNYFFDRDSGTHALVLPGGAISVRHGWYELAGNLYRMQPFIDRTERAVIVFYGALSNVDDLLMRIGKFGKQALRKMLLETEGRAAQRGIDNGTLTARVLLQLYLEHRARDPELVLSELEGQYAFVIYDSARKQVFAARDPSGKQPLHFCQTDGTGVSFTNSPLDVPDAEKKSEWQEVPPGHFVAGKNLRIQQFALTPEQLHIHKSMDSFANEEWSLPMAGSPIQSGLFGSIGRSLKRRSVELT